MMWKIPQENLANNVNHKRYSCDIINYVKGEPTLTKMGIVEHNLNPETSEITAFVEGVPELTAEYQSVTVARPGQWNLKMKSGWYLNFDILDTRINFGSQRSPITVLFHREYVDGLGLVETEDRTVAVGACGIDFWGKSQ